MESKKVFFIGGIHGVGKGTICKEISESIGIKDISASTLLKWEEVSEFPENKVVKDIPDTQQRLLNGINDLDNGCYLIDGHFTLFDSNYHITTVDIDVFYSMNPLSLAIVVNDVNIIAKRLLKRDGKEYDPNFLEKMQISEIEHAKKVSGKLDVPLFIIDNKEFCEYRNHLRSIINC